MAVALPTGQSGGFAPIGTMSALAWVAGIARSLPATSGPMPDGSPRNSPMRGLLLDIFTNCSSPQSMGKLQSGLTPDLELLAPLRRYWGYDGFRPMQERIVRSLLAGRDICVVMPTGGGKSLCYQLPALVLGRTAVVISPLIALMQDQAAQLAQMGIPAAVLNSSMPSAEQWEVVRRARAGEYRLLYLSPERLARPDTIGWLQNAPVAFFAIDEA